MLELYAKKIRKILVKENRIYIIPNGRGFTFLGTIVVLILAAATYNNNLVFILGFMMFALFVVAMVQTHYNLKGVRLHLLSTSDAFEGEAQSLLFQIEQRYVRNKYALSIRSRSREWPTLHSPLTNLEPLQKRIPVRMAVRAFKRGVHSPPEFTLESNYPLGLFLAWKVFRPKGELVVYPKTKGQRELSEGSHAEGEEELGLRNSPEGDFGELKEYLPGESYRQIAWKHFARTGELYTKVHWGDDNRVYKIPWDPQEQSFEEYLCQMSAWIQLAVDENAAFSMDLPGNVISIGQGADHARECWRALAALKGVA